jgi:hypothetical protein
VVGAGRSEIWTFDRQRRECVERLSNVEESRIDVDAEAELGGSVAERGLNDARRDAGALISAP